MKQWVNGVCEANGINIHYLRTGGSKPPLLLLHGLTASGACWIPLARTLEDEYDVVMPDARGHGHSSAPPGGYRYGNYASDVLGLIHGLGLDAPVLLGHSMGGMTAAVVASHSPHAFVASSWRTPPYCVLDANVKCTRATSSSNTADFSAWIRRMRWRRRVSGTRIAGRSSSSS